MDQITHEVRLSNWKKVIEECQTIALSNTVSDGLLTRLLQEVRHA